MTTLAKQESRWERVKKNPSSVKESITISRYDWGKIHKFDKNTYNGKKYTYTHYNKWIIVKIK